MKHGLCPKNTPVGFGMEISDCLQAKLIEHTGECVIAGGGSRVGLPGQEEHGVATTEQFSCAH